MKKKFQVMAGLAVMVVVALGLAGCDHYVCSSGATFGASSCSASGGGPGINNTQTAFVFFADVPQEGFAAEGLNVADSGNFASVAGFVPPLLPQTPGEFGGMAIVAKKYLYLSYLGNTGSGPNELVAYSIAPASGALTAIGAPIQLGGAPSLPALAADPAGNFIFVGMGTEIGVYGVNANTGALTAVGTVPTGSNPTQMTTDGLGKFLYTIEGSAVSAYSYDTSGTLTLVGTGFGAGPGLTQISGEKSGAFLLGIAGVDGANNTDMNVYVMVINPQSGSLGTLTSTGTGDTPAFLAVSPTAETLYTFNSQQNGGNPKTIGAMQGFNIGSGGALTAVNGSPFANILATRGSFDQSGNFIFAYARENSLLSTTPLAVDSNGSVSTTNFGVAGAVDLVPFAVTDEP